MVSKLNLTCLRFLRWTILVSLLIYVSLVIIKYNKSIPLKSLPTPSDQNKDSLMIDNLFLELEAVTDKNLKRYKDVKIDRRNDQDIRQMEEIGNYKNSRILLEDIFGKADIDGNQLLDIQELAKWIHAKITEHIFGAMRDNVKLFTNIDNNPRNGTGHYQRIKLVILLL